MKEREDMNNLKKGYENIEIPDELDLVIEKAIIKGKKHNRIKELLIPMSTAACFLLFAFTVSYSSGFGKIVSKAPAAKIVPAQSEKINFPIIGSLDNLKNVISKSPYNYTNGRASASDDSVDGKGASMKSVSSPKDYSTTNLQVSGVEEADIVKNDGEYIYDISKGNIIIAKVYPSQNMKIQSTIKMSGDYMPYELFIYNKYMVIVCSRRNYGIADYKIPSDPYNNDFSINSASSDTKILIYNIQDKIKPEKIREIDIDGYYLSSRRIGGEFYIISNKTLQFDKNVLTEDNEPQYKDSLSGNKTFKISYDKIHYCPDAVEPNYIVTAVFSLDNVNEKAKVSAFLGSGNNIYCSDKNLYVAAQNYDRESHKASTAVYKFSLEKGSIKFSSKGEVPGSILNQFSMDENDKTFRIATCSYEDTTNNLYVLDENMNIKGKLEGLEKGEKIYAVRFMGDRAYMVTFEQTDPLLVIDLKNAEKPAVLGELKIPGFSNYLQPYDENHLIGIGKDVDIDNISLGNGLNKKVALTQGMKIAMFDVTDINKPVMQFVESIGGRGTDSAALYNHKALLFSKEKNILAFPVMVTSTDDTHSIVFTGAYVYSIDLKEGFKLKGTITHAQRGGSLEGDSIINRILYIEDTLYTVSNRVIKANDINDLSEKGTLNIEK